MPTKTCAICERQRMILSSQYNLLDSGGEFVCRKSCILRWLDLREVPARTPLWMDLAIRLEQPAYPNFKSDYEQHFSEWMTRNGISWVYEGYQFRLDEHKSYTPDFFLPIHFAFIETKGRWGAGQKNKLRIFRQRFSNAALLVIPWVMSEQFYSQENDWLR